VPLVELKIVGDPATIGKAAKPNARSKRGQMIIDALWGTATTKMTTDEILGLTRGEPRRARKRKK
jgi:hypothetical protein